MQHASRRPTSRQLLQLTVAALGLLCAFAGPSHAEPSKPDLAATKIKLPTDSSAMFEGYTFTFAALLTNQGSLAADSSAEFSIDNATIGSVLLGPMVAQGRMILRSPSWNATAGSHQIGVTVDSKQEINEEREDNNRVTLNFRIKAKGEQGVAIDARDYQVVSVSKFDSCYHEKLMAYEGGSLQVRSTVRLAGYPLPPMPANVTLLVDGEALFEKLVTFPAYDPINVTSAWSRNLTQGRHSIAAVVNFNGNGSDPFHHNDYATATLWVDRYGMPCEPTPTPSPSNSTTTTTPTGSRTTTSTTPNVTVLLALATVGAVVLIRRRP